VTVHRLADQSQFVISLLVTATLSRKIDSLDNWCLRRILNIHWTEFVTNDEVRSSTGQPLLSDTVQSRRLSFFGHLNRADPCQDRELCRLALRTLPYRLATKAWPSQTIVAQNGGDRPASAESWPGDGKATHAGQSGMAATRRNGNVDLEKLLNDDGAVRSIFPFQTTKIFPPTDPVPTYFAAVLLKLCNTNPHTYLSPDL